MLPTMAALADRIAPWVDVYVVPYVFTRNSGDYKRKSGSYMIDDEAYKSCGGFAVNDRDVVFVTEASPVFMMRALAHELMHKLWDHHLNDEARDVLRGAAGDGIGWPGSYYDDTEERVARLFEIVGGGAA